MKTLVFSFDGTGNESSDAEHFSEDESISNVLKLHVLMGGGLRVDKSKTKTASGNLQETHYYNGIGTRDTAFSFPFVGRLVNAVHQGFEMALAPKFGDAEAILKEAGQDFAAAGYQKQEGDKLVVFGFSRGAALARQFVAQLLEAHSECEVSFLGVFDTVAAMGGFHREGEEISSRDLFENGTLHAGVRKAVHLVALDEDRVTFAPTLINRDLNGPGRILEVWFPGVHSDIGGGYWYDGLSDVALQFMIEQCRLELGDDIRVRKGDGDTIRELIVDQGTQLEVLSADDVAIHPLVNGVMHSHSGLSAVGGQEPRTVRVNDDDEPCEELPLVHWSVKERFDTVTDYRPMALRNRRFRLFLRDGRHSAAIEGISGLREFR